MSAIYNPIDGTLLQGPDNLKQLNKLCYKARNKLQQLQYTSRLSLDYSNITKWQLITDYIAENPNVEDILNISDTSNPNTAKNKMYETLWDILIKFNFTNIQKGISNENIHHYNGKIENTDIKKVIFCYNM
jgi:hypothetical protein